MAAPKAPPQYPESGMTSAGPTSRQKSKMDGMWALLPEAQNTMLRSVQ